MRNFAVQLEWKSHTNKLFNAILSVKIKDVLRALERFAPLPLQEDYDNAGLQVGLTEAEVSGALLCLDVTEKVVDEAERRGCNLIVAHHPLIFRRLSCVSDADYVQRTVYKAIQKGIAIAAMHTNLDNAMGGVNFKIAQHLQLDNVQLLAAKHTYENAEGVYEYGSGVVGELPEPLAAVDFIQLLKREFGVKCLQANQLISRKVKRVALCGGAGAFLLRNAIAAGADAFVTGEMGYHEFFGHEQEIQICVIGHYQSEQYTCQLLQEIIEKEFPNMPTCIVETNTNPIIYV